MDAADAEEIAVRAAPASTRERKRLARRALVAFVLTFAAARVLVYAIMSRRVPDLYFYVGQTHVHHLNYGIFLLSAVGAMMLFAARTPAQFRWCATLYGIGLALTFDEFGMWLHLGGAYWQRLSFDAVIVIAGLLTLLAVAPRVKQLRAREIATGAILCGAVGVLVIAMFDAVQRSSLPQRVERLEKQAPQ